MTMHTTPKYNLLLPEETPDCASREIARAHERGIVNAVTGAIRDDYVYFDLNPLELTIPNGSTHRWLLAFQQIAGRFQILTYEENTPAGTDQCVVAPPIALADGSLAPLVHFVPRLQAFVDAVKRDAPRISTPVKAVPPAEANGLA